ILADEPTANLDSESGYKVMELLKDIAQKEDRAVVVVTHDLRLVSIADRVLWMDDGRIKEGQDKIVVDPICKMPLKKHQSLYTLSYERKRYHFCSMKCLEEFRGKNGK
ncbi:MAG: YHS domain-containing protein, partial [Candidatus Heimdallarchaeota archaeon]